MSVLKAAKAIVFSAQAHENHITIKVRNVLKWLKAGHEVRVQVSGKADRQKAIEGILDTLERESKVGAKVMQKAVKPGSAKMIMRPTEGAINIKIPDDRAIRTVEDEIEQLTSDKDIFSPEFEQDLIKSIRDERKNKKK